MRERFSTFVSKSPSFLEYTFFYKKNVYKKMSPKKLKTSRKSRASIVSPAIFKTQMFPRALLKLQNWVSFNIFSSLKFFSFFITNGTTIVTCKFRHLLTYMLENNVYWKDIQIMRCFQISSWIVSSANKGIYKIDSN